MYTEKKPCHSTLCTTTYTSSSKCLLDQNKQTNKCNTESRQEHEKAEPSQTVKYVLNYNLWGFLFVCFFTDVLDVSAHPGVNSKRQRVLFLLPAFATQETDIPMKCQYFPQSRNPISKAQRMYSIKFVLWPRTSGRQNLASTKLSLFF